MRPISCKASYTRVNSHTLLYLLSITEECIEVTELTDKTYVTFHKYLCFVLRAGIVITKSYSLKCVKRSIQFETDLEKDKHFYMTSVLAKIHLSEKNA